MKKMSARIRGAFFITKQANHHIVHILLGIFWFYLLQQTIHQLELRHFFLAILGSELPDAEHLIYFYLHGRRDVYSVKVKNLIRNRQWRELTLFLKNNHKYLTTLKFHCLQWVFFLTILTGISFIFDHYATVVMLGAMVTHYVFDIVDDFIFLGKMNPNWKRGIIKKPKLS